MSAYSNFRAINDQSAMGWASISAGLAQGLTSLGTSYAKSIEANVAQTKKDQEKYDLTWAQVAIDQRKSVSDAQQDLKDEGASDEITKLFLNQQKLLMDGRGKPGDSDYIMGSIEAETLLKTKPGDQQQRNKYLDIVDKANNNIDAILERGGVLMTDVEIIKKLDGSVGPGREQQWLGNSFGERTASSFTGFRLSNQSVPGVSTSVKLNDGNGDLVFTHTIKKSDPKVSDLGKELNSKWFKNNVKDDGKGNWVITQKLGKDFKGDILRDVPQAINYIEEGGTPAVNVLKDGDLMEMYQVKIPTYQIQDPNNLDYEIPVDSKIVNKQLVDDAFSQTLAGKIERIYQLDNQQKGAYFANRRDITISDDFYLKSAEEQKKFIKEVELKAYEEEIFGDFVKRKMTSEEITALTGQNGFPSNTDPNYKAWTEAEHYFSQDKKGNRINVGEGTLGYNAKEDQKNYDLLYNTSSHDEGDTIFVRRGNKSDVKVKAVYKNGKWQLQKLASVSKTVNGQTVSMQQWVDEGDPTTKNSLSGLLGYTK